MILKFSVLLPYVPHVARNYLSILSPFLPGLHTLVMTDHPSTYQTVENVKKIEASLLRREPQPVPVFVPQGSGSSMSMPISIPPYQPLQSYQQSKQQRFKSKDKQFKKSRSSSTSSGST